MMLQTTLTNVIISTTLTLLLGFVLGYLFVKYRKEIDEYLDKF